MAGLPWQSSHQPRGEHLILYDGVCALCNRTNAFVLARDTRRAFAFASLQSDAARRVLLPFGKSPDALDTFYIVAGYRTAAPRLLARSEAALFLIKTLGAPWKWLGFLAILPRALRDRAYDLVARNRYRLFGRSDTCLMPAAEYKQRFIDSR